MDLSLTWRGDYCVRAALALSSAAEDRGWVTAATIAGATSIPVKYAPQILAQLVHAGLVEARAGRQGGYRLRRPPSAITLLEVVEAADGEIANRRCVLRGGGCGDDGTCAVHEHWVAAQRAMREQLGAVTLARVVEGRPGAATFSVREPRR